MIAFYVVTGVWAGAAAFFVVEVIETEIRWRREFGESMPRSLLAHGLFSIALFAGAAILMVAIGRTI